MEYVYTSRVYHYSPYETNGNLLASAGVGSEPIHTNNTTIRKKTHQSLSNKHCCKGVVCVGCPGSTQLLLVPAQSWQDATKYHAS